MAPPATKRRKLSHSSSEESEADSFGGFNGEENGFHTQSSNEEQDAGMSDDGSLDEYAVENGGMEVEKEEDDSDDDEVDDAEAVEHDGEDENLSVAHSDNDRAIKKDSGNSKVSKSRDRQPARRRDSMDNGTYNGEIYKSNLFKLQVDELLEQVRPKYGKREAPAEQAMRTLKSIIEALPDREKLPVAEAERTLIKSSKVAIPFSNPRPPKAAQYKLAYAKPAHINATGSYPLKIATRTGEEMAIDLIITMPSNLFDTKDYLNYRYFYKRAYYLACIAAGIKTSKGHKFDLSFENLNGNALQPILVVKVTGEGGSGDFSSSKCEIHIIPTISESLFPLEKTLPSSNCVRPKTEDASSAPKLNPTPFYNASLRSDALMTPYLKVLHDAAKQCESFKDACLLGRIWLRQRGFGGAICKGGFGNFEWAGVTALLLQSSPGSPSVLSPGYSSYQLFKAMLQFLASQDLVRSPYIFQGKGLSVAKTVCEPTFFDGPRGINLLFKMSAWSYRLLRHEAQMSVAMLGDSVFDLFEPTFILRADPPLHRFDILVAIPISSIGLPLGGEEQGLKLQETYFKIYKVLTRALGDRASLVSLTVLENRRWQLGSSRPSADWNASLLVGFVLDAANASRTVDHGPSAEAKKEAASFRQFWGEKAELRRFKDGSILESLVWSSKSSVIEQIVAYVLERHLGKDVAEKATLIGDDLGKMLPSAGQMVQTGTAPFKPIMDAFTALERDIRSLEGMPLTVRHLVAADPQLRYSSIEVPLSGSKTIANVPADVVIQFEGSARWPDDLIAIQRTKIGFLLKLGELLTESVPIIKTRIGIENADNNLLNQSYLDIIYTDSLASFRLRIHHDREETLLSRQLKLPTLAPSQRESVAQALAAYKRTFLRATQHGQAIQTLATREPALSSAIRLLKSWFASHLLSPHFGDELIELLAARTFLHPAPFNVPQSPQTAFLRTLLFLSRWDWRAEPLILDFSSSMDQDTYDAIRTRFEAWRKIDPALNRVVLFVASDRDPEGQTWTELSRPPKVAAARMTQLARAACQYAEKESIKMEPANLFSSPLMDYDFLIHLSPAFTRSGGKRRGSGDKPRFKNLEIGTRIADAVSKIGHTPVEFLLKDLEESYGNAVVWFYDGRGGDVIAGLWSPGIGRRGWRVRLGWSSVPVWRQGKAEGKESLEVEANRMGMLAEIARLGGDMIKRIEVVKK